MEMKEFFDQAKGELAGFIAKAQEEMKTLGKVTEETAKAVQAQTKRLDDIEVKFARPTAGSEQKTLSRILEETESLQRLQRDGRGSALIRFKGGITEIERLARLDWEQKTTITSATVGSATSGVLLFERVPGIVPAARRRLFVRDLLTTIPTSSNAVDYAKVVTDISDASPQVEGSDKLENELTFTTASALVRTIGTWIPAAKQVLEDFAGLEGFIRTSLVYAVRKVEEQQILSGDNTGVNLNGLITQATAFNTGLLVASDGWKYSDIIARACQQIETANEASPDFAVLSPASYWQIRLQKTTTGEYVFGPPSQDAGVIQVFGLTIIRSNALSGTTFLIGSSAPSEAVIRDRMELTVEISTEHSDYFVKNLVAIRAEERLALVVFRPAAYITGSFTQSPA